MTDEAQAALDRLMASGEVELDPKTYAAVVKLFTGSSPALPPGYNDPIERTGTRAQRSAVNREAHRIISERRDEDAREAREARRAESAAAKSRPGTQPDSSTAEQGKGKG